MGEKHGGARFVWWLYTLFIFLAVAVKFTGSFSELAERMAAGSSVNLTPFKTIRIQWQYFSSPWGRRNMLGNTLPFIPLGFISPVAFDTLRAPHRFFPFALLYILGIELFQLASGLGSFDVDDIMLNMLGAAVGYLLCPGKRQHNMKKSP